MNKIARVLMKRDGMTYEEFFGLEPDYLDELIPF